MTHLTGVLDKTQALRARLNQIDTLVGVTDTQIKEEILSPGQIAQLDGCFEDLSNNLEPDLDGSISSIETILGI